MNIIDFAYVVTVLKIVTMVKVVIVSIYLDSTILYLEATIV